jgi:drug/metabolite transporter (DMT)-like permease
VEIVLALGAAVAYGASDFTGGLLSKKTAVPVVVLFSQIVSIVLVMLVSPFFGHAVTAAAIGWGSAAGVAGGAGAAMLYRGLAVGQMSVVAPISGVLAAGVPVVAGLSFGEQPGGVALAGVGMGLIAVVAVSRAPGPTGSSSASEGASGLRPGIAEGLGAGIGFGLFFVLLERSPANSGLWPLVGVRTSMILLMATIAIVTRAPLTLRSIRRWHVAGLGVLITIADLLYLLATREGLLSLVGVITSLYPAATVILAGAVLRERMTRHQVIGLAFAALSVALIAVR